MDPVWDGPRYRFWFGVPHAPVWLPIAALGAMLACRIPSSLGVTGWPPLAFPNILFAAVGLDGAVRLAVAARAARLRSCRAAALCRPDQ